MRELGQPARLSSGSHRLRYIAPALRRLPRAMRGKTRLARLLLGPSLQDRDLLVHGNNDCLFAVPSVSEPVGFHLVVNGVYEADEVAFALRALQPGGVFLDVGANIGTYTVPAAKRVGPNGRVVAVEASPGVFPYLARNICLNGLSNVRLVQCAALAENAGAVPFYEAPPDHFGMGALSEQFGATPVEVQARTLDTVLSECGLDSVDLLKVDVEGFEVDVFAGAERLLTGDRPPRILFEFCDWAEARRASGHPGDAQRLLRDCGYRVWRLQELLRGRPPLKEVLTDGFEALVAMRD
jgi:FkbM family methyltransferase